MVETNFQNGTHMVDQSKVRIVTEFRQNVQAMYGPDAAQIIQSLGGDTVEALYPVALEYSQPQTPVEGQDAE